MCGSWLRRMVVPVLLFGAVIAACSDSSGGSDPVTLTPILPPDPVCEALSDNASVAPHPLPAPATPADALVTVDLDDPVGAANTNLTGVVWNTGSNVDTIAALKPATVRIDASLQDRSPAPGQLDMAPLLGRIADIRAIGAEPLILLSYMPRWLGQPSADARNPGANPTRMAPYDLDAWQQLIHDVVYAAATAPQGARLFEVWNEPDLSIFWLDTDQAFIDMAVRTHRAVVQVAQETGLDLLVGGPAMAVADNIGTPRMAGYLQAVVAEGLPLDFWSWHRYANVPYLGPDGAEGNLPEKLYQNLARINTDASPLDYSAEIAEVRAYLDTALAGSGGLDPFLTIDEWNVSGGGYDLRHDRAEGAAFDAGILIEMERAGLDAANFYRSASGSRPGDWGLVAGDGTLKPAWWLFRAWATMTGDRLAVTDDPDTGVFARATRSTAGCVQVVLSNFVAAGGSNRTVHVDLDGSLPAARCETTVSILDTGSVTLESATPVEVAADGSVDLALPAQSVALLRFDC